MMRMARISAGARRATLKAAQRGPKSLQRFFNSDMGVIPKLTRERSIGWAFTENKDFEEAMKKSLIHDLVDHGRNSAEEVVPWFMDQMPKDYFDQIPKKIWFEHLRALNALFEMKETPDLMMKSPCETYTSFIKPHNYAGLINQMVQELPSHQSPTQVRAFTSLDCVLGLNVFNFGEQEPATEADVKKRYWPNLKKYLDTQKEMKDSTLFNKENLKEYMGKCPKTYLNLCSPQRFVQQRRQYERVVGSELVDVKVSRDYQWHSRHDTDKRYALVSIATHNHSTRVTLENFSNYMASRQLDVEFLYLDRISEPGKYSHVDMMSILLHDPEDMSDASWEEIRNDLERIKWIDTAALEAFNQSRSADGTLTLVQAEIISAFVHMLHGKMNSTDSRSISLEKMLSQVYGPYLNLSTEIAQLFKGRFHPRATMPASEQETRTAEIRGRIRTVVASETRNLLELMLSVASEAKKTNLYVPNRMGLSISVNPENLVTPKHRGGLPYGVFFVHGRRCNMFHVRFREHSRGGMRVATPNGIEEYALRSLNHYEEAYGLASTQQAKNKDIAEGGSKAVVLVRMNEEEINRIRDRIQHSQDEDQKHDAEVLVHGHKDRMIFRSVMSCTDALLDLITPEEKLQEDIVVYGDRQEFVYLGPDEQIVPKHINWITQRAKERKLPYANAFMSSKPKTGINHKEYGVTSEGVCIFLDVALKNMGKNPRQTPFTLKMTGGPGGDVAGNAIKILNRDYGTNAKIIGIVDHTACAEDPEGLDHKELLRLVNEDLTVSEFSKASLSKGGKVWMRDTNEGRLMCDSMHNRLEADAFLPAGGLPNTIRLDNWEQFMKADGTPSSKLIVEAANIFIEQDARERLTERGVLIVKDSSANKCGVICSAMEIIANLLLSEEEFLACRTEYVDDVLEHLRHLARMEAEILFEEYKKKGGSTGEWGDSLPGIAERVSRVLNLCADSISEQIGDVMSHEEIFEFAARSLLPTLRSKADGRLTKLPISYAKNMVATNLASQLVYTEGLDYVERSLPRNKFAAVALEYAREAEQVSDMMREIEESGLAHKTEIAELLRIGGTRAAVSKGSVFTSS